MKRQRPLLAAVLARKEQERKAVLSKLQEEAAFSEKTQQENPQDKPQTKEASTRQAQPSESISTPRSANTKRPPPEREGEQQARFREPPAKKARVNIVHTKKHSPPKPVPKNGNRHVALRAVQPPAKGKRQINASPINSPPPRRSRLEKIRPEDATQAEILQRDNKLPTGKVKTPTESLPSPKASNSSGEPSNKTSSSAAPSLPKGQRTTQTSNKPFVFRSKKPDAVPPPQLQGPKALGIDRILRKEPDPKAVPLPTGLIAPLFRGAPLTVNDVASLDVRHAASIRKESKESLRREDPEEIIKALKQAYSTSAKSLYIRATGQIDLRYSKLKKKLQESTKTESNFLNKIEKQIETISAPLSGFTIQSEQRAPDGTVSIKISTSAELVSTTESRVNKLKTDIRRLWKEWAAADAEARVMYNEAVNPKDTQANDGAPSTSSATATAAPGGSASISPSKEAGPLERAHKILEEELEEANEQFTQLSEMSLEVIKEIEKDFVKSTMPDLHVFYKSIEMP